jgi:hypothetical protein
MVHGIFLEQLKKAGADGIAEQAIMDAVGHHSINSLYTSLFRLRSKGYKIEKRDDKLFLISEPAEPSAVTGETLGTPQDKPGLSKKPNPKYLQLMEILKNAGPNGVEREALSQMIGVTVGNLIFHLHQLRKMKYKIKYNHDSHHYIMLPKATPAAKPAASFKETFPTAGTGAGKKCPLSELPEEVKANLSLLDAGQRETYLDFLYKAMFYKESAESIIKIAKQIQIYREAVC